MDLETMRLDAASCRKVAAELKAKLCWASSDRAYAVLLHNIATNEAMADRLEAQLKGKP